MTNLNFHSWWGRQSIEPQRTDLWQIGPLRLWIRQLAQRWQISWIQSGDWLDQRVRVVTGGGGEEPPSPYAQTLSCIIGSGARTDLLFVPTLADRALLTRFESPLHILPGETTNIYVLSPLRLRIEVADGAKLLHEIPTFRPSDTWFGPITGASSASTLPTSEPPGELCYANPSAAFLDLREVPIRLHCAISTVTIRNSGRQPLRMDRLCAPLPRLSLFYSPRTGFWTDSLSLTCDQNKSGLASLRLDRQPPLEAQPSQFVAGPRVGAPPSVGQGQEAGPASVAETITPMRAFSAVTRDI